MLTSSSNIRSLQFLMSTDATWDPRKYLGFLSLFEASAPLPSILSKGTLKQGVTKQTDKLPTISLKPIFIHYTKKVTSCYRR